MPSKQIEAVAALYGRWGEGWAANPQMPLDEWRAYRAQLGLK